MPKKINKVLKNILVIFFSFLFIAGAFSLLNPDALQKNKEVSLSALSQKIAQGNIKEIQVAGDKITAIDKEGQKISSRKESGVSLSETLKAYGITEEQIKAINIKIEEEKQGLMGWLFPLSLILPIIIFALFFWVIARQARGGPGGGGFNFLKAPAKLFGDGKDGKQSEKVTFKDIAGLEEAKEEIEEVVDFLKNPKKYYKMGARIPRGVLLVGPPGVGKTLLARAVANESGVPFFSIAGSAFIELFVGVGSSRVRNLFETAKKHAPSLIFIDELDAIGKIRMPGLGGGHEEREQTLNQILAEMDGFERETGIIVLAATNAPQMLDPALLRPGRFDRRIVLDLPDVKGREEILKIHTQGKPLSGDVNLREIAERTPGFSGADLANLVNEAAILAARQGQEQITQKELLISIEKVMLGPERKSHLLSEKEKEISAYHEAGHALLTATLPDAEEVRKISIVARGMAAGYTLALPKQEKRIRTKSEFKAELAVLLAGYTAERLTFKELSTGASNDLEKANELARDIVTKYGMAKFGPRVFGVREALPFLGWEQETEKNYSEKMAAEIDEETTKFIKEAEVTATKVLTQKKAVLEKIAKALIEKETLEKEEFEALINNSRKTKKANKTGL